jgi:small subunit ribosomal protein S20
MPVTKTAKRALRSSKRKNLVNAIAVKNLEIAIRTAKKSKTSKDVARATSLSDRAVKKNIIHKGKAARIKSSLSKMLPQKSKVQTNQPVKSKSSKASKKK